MTMSGGTLKHDVVKQDVVKLLEWSVALGLGPRATILSRGCYSWWTPHRDVIFVSYVLQKLDHKCNQFEKFSYTHMLFLLLLFNTVLVLTIFYLTIVR